MIKTQQAQKLTYSEVIKAHLQAGHTISTWDAYRLYNITCLAQRISELRRDGLPINDKMVIQNGKRFKLYWLNHNYISNCLYQR